MAREFDYEHTPLQINDDLLSGLKFRVKLQYRAPDGKNFIGGTLAQNSEEIAETEELLARNPTLNSLLNSVSYPVLPGAATSSRAFCYRGSDFNTARTVADALN